MLARATLICLLVASAVAPAEASQLCPEGPRTSAAAAIRNDDKRTVGELLGIAPRSMEIVYSSTQDVETRVREVLAARPRLLSPFINWAEGADLRSQGFIVNLQTARLEVAGYQVCVRDGKGGYWYFRNVPGDLWPQ